MPKLKVYESVIRIRKVGNAGGVLLPKRWLDSLKVDAGDYIMVTVRKLTTEEKKGLALINKG